MHVIQTTQYPLPAFSHYTALLALVNGHDPVSCQQDKDSLALAIDKRSVARAWFSFGRVYCFNIFYHRSIYEQR